MTHWLNSIGLYLIIFQIIFIVLLGVFGNFNLSLEEVSEINTFYPMFMDVHSMMFVGFGFLMTFLKRHGFSSVGYNFLIAAVVLEWASIIRGFIRMIEHKTNSFEIGVLDLLEADFCSAAILISFGAVIGKVTLSQLFVMTIIEVVIQSFNQYVCLHYIKAYDVGESIYVHVFGAYFGLGVAKALHNHKIENEKESSSYNSDLFAMIGTLFLWLYWPSFNSATAKDEGKLRSIVNTYFSITASCVMTFMISYFVEKGKLNMIHIQNATLAGGVAIGTVADMITAPVGSVIIGSFAGIVSTLGFKYLNRLLRKIYLHDTCGVHNLHGIPGVISGIAGGIMAAIASRENFNGNNLYKFYPSRVPPIGSEDYIRFGLNETEFSEGGIGRTNFEHGGYQILGLLLTLGMAIVGGLLTGFIMRLPFIYKLKENENMFEDENHWEIEDHEFLAYNLKEDKDIIENRTLRNKTMSLFKTRDIWSTSCDNDLFDQGCLKVGNVGANKKSKNSIITGSYNGYLRIYNPNFDKDLKSSDTDSMFKAHDLICEVSFPSPIIQIDIGKFISQSKKNQIAVLMPKKLAVYEVSVLNDGNVEHGNQFNLKLVYEHTLQRTAFNMCKGPFGGFSGSEPHEYICVQSIDGMLSIFEYESFSLSCFIPKTLIPMPIKYIAKTDSFVTVSSSWELEMYNYQTLATSAKTFERQTSSDNNSTVKSKRILPAYSYNLGESILDIEVFSHNNNCSILVLGERNLFCFSETCNLKFMKKFEYNPSAFCAYPIYTKDGSISQTNSLNFIITTHAKNLFVHEDVKVKWAAQLNHVPVQVCVAKIDNINGMIVTLSEDGKLDCSYLGTEPAFLNPLLKEEASKPFNFESAEKEYRALQSQIKNAIMNTGAVITKSTKTGLILNIEVPNKLDSISSNRSNLETELRDPIDSIPSITCKLSLKSMEGVQNVRVVINCKAPICAVPDNICYSSIGAVAYEQDILFYPKTKHIPASLDVSICASYVYVQNGAPRISECKFSLPLKLVMKSGLQSSKADSAEKDSKNNQIKKITIETNRPCVNLTELFPEFSSSYIPANGNVIAAQFYGHANINILIQGSKSSSNRYRLQSDNYETLWLISKEFVARLNSFYSKQSQKIEIFYQESLPTEDFRLIIDKHLEVRQQIENFKELLEKSCAQFRAVQKRMLIKFKDKSPSTLDNMDALLEATYRQIVSISDSLIQSQSELNLVTNSLNCFSSLYVLLISLAFKFSKEGLEMLESAMTTQSGDTSEYGWEEMVNAAVSSMMKIYFKNSRDTQVQTQQIKAPVDSSKLEKQLKSFVSKLEAGSSLLPSSANKEIKSDEKSTPRDQQKNEEPIKRGTLADKNRNTMGEDYEYFDSNNQKDMEKKDQEKRPFGSKKLPTFEELMASEEFKNKNDSNYELDDD
ncbi:unnamed protein product [Brachionus calyciflorus]|uniref:Uncharacterized protein n=1 Tax=Brachionus calyciflorus TaxID=104777 RepID=A0A813QPW2_9BILA|nr:unnamed protein product [Brachionus calyciflorus]